MCPWVIRRRLVGSRGWAPTEGWRRRGFLCCTQSCCVLQMHFLFLCWGWNLKTGKYNWVQKSILEGTEPKTSKQPPPERKPGKRTARVSFQPHHYSLLGGKSWQQNLKFAILLAIPLLTLLVGAWGPDSITISTLCQVFRHIFSYEEPFKKGARRAIQYIL